MTHSKSSLQLAEPSVFARRFNPVLFCHLYIQRTPGYKHFNTKRLSTSQKTPGHKHFNTKHLHHTEHLVTKTSTQNTFLYHTEQLATKTSMQNTFLHHTEITWSQQRKHITPFYITVVIMTLKHTLHHKSQHTFPHWKCYRNIQCTLRTACTPQRPGNLETFEVCTQDLERKRDFLSHSNGMNVRSTSTQNISQLLNCGNLFDICTKPQQQNLQSDSHQCTNQQNCSPSRDGHMSVFLIHAWWSVLTILVLGVG